MIRPPNRSILVALDLGQRSEDLLRSASLIAEETRATLHVSHALDLQLPDEGGDPKLSRRLRDARSQVEDRLNRLVPPHMKVGSCEVAPYAAHRAILERSEAVRAELIVMGPRRTEGERGAFLGSTVDHVVRSTTVPCLVVNGLVRMPLERAMVPLDLSAVSRTALATAHAWACRFGIAGRGVGRTELLVVHVMPELERLTPGSSYRARVGRLLDAAVAFVVARDECCAVSVRELLLAGDDVAAVIAGAARRDRTDLVVLGTQGGGAVARPLLGSVSLGVLRRAPCPVLVLPPPMQETPRRPVRAEKPGSTAPS